MISMHTHQYTSRLSQHTTAIALAIIGVLSTGMFSCGARTGLLTWDAPPPEPQCATDDDCNDGLFCTGVEACIEERCVQGIPVACNDDNACTIDVCSEEQQACTHTPRSRDEDGDGYNAIPFGENPGMCGNDCNDRNVNIHPGATEICNGQDDNCNGIIDDNAIFSPAEPDVAVSDLATAPSGPGGIAWSGERYLSSFWGYNAHTAHVYFSAFDANGTRVSTPPQIQITQSPSDSFGAVVAWSGRYLGIAWQDRRNGDYEIYFNRLSPTGEKLGEDQRLSFASGFSINPSITWTGREFVVAWQDERDSLRNGSYEVYAQRIDEEGRQLGADNVRLTRDPSNSEVPIIAASPTGLAVAWLDGRGEGSGPMREFRSIFFAAFTFGLQRLTPDIRLTPTTFVSVYPVLAWNRDRWVVAWYDETETSNDHEVWATTLDAGGVIVNESRRITMDPGFSRYPALVTLGDRMLVLWADDRAGGGYDLWGRMLSADLEPLTPETRITNAPRDSVYPLATLGPTGDVGILYRDHREQQWQVRFTRLRCALP